MIIHMSVGVLYLFIRMNRWKRLKRFNHTFDNLWGGLEVKEDVHHFILHAFKNLIVLC